MSYHSKRKDANNYYLKVGDSIKSGTIYLITNLINNKKYVGQTIQKPEIRFNYHLNYASKDYNISNMPLSRAINKYGKNNFKFEILEECLIDDLNERESYYIKKYDSFYSGYNATLGGTYGKKIDINIEEMINLYHQLKSARKVAEYYKVDKDCICDRLKSLNIEFYTLAQQRGINVKILKDNELITEFDSKKQCAEWLIQNNLTKSDKVESVRKIIHNNKLINGYKIVISDKI